MKIEWRAQALRELVAIVAHISRESPTGAARIHSQILHSVSFLADWPGIGRTGRRGYRELVVSHSPYVVLYKQTRESVVIVRVLHGSRKR